MNTLIELAKQGNVTAVRNAFKKGADVNENNYGTTALMCASANGHSGMVRLLIAKVLMLVPKITRATLL